MKHNKKALIGLITAFTTTMTLMSGCSEPQENTSSIFESVDIDAENSAASKASNGNAGVDEDGYAQMVVSKADLADVGLSQESFDLISDIINADIDHGFSSAQLAVVKDGKLVYQNAWGDLDSYNPDGSRRTDFGKVTNDTLYDLASNTKMYSIAYAAQYLVGQGKLSLDDKIVDILGQEFVDNTADIEYKGGKAASLDTIKEWKSEVTVFDVMTHQSGFPADPHYNNEHYSQKTSTFKDGEVNELYSGEHEETADITTSADRARTYEQICRTSLSYQPGTQTVYSDVDYMIMTYVIEKIAGEDLDTFLRDTFWKPMGLKEITYKPLDHGYTAEDCAATELNGNTRDGVISFAGVRTDTIQGTVHDEKAYYSMDGISGHAGLFASATDLALLESLMIDGTYQGTQYFSKEVLDTFTSAKDPDNAKWGVGWWRQGDKERTKYFGDYADSDVIGHQGWTGTLTVIDRKNNLCIAFLTNKINTPVTDPNSDPNTFDGSSYLTSELGFVTQLIYMGMNTQDSDSFKANASQYLNDKIAERDDKIASTGADTESALARSKASLEEVSLKWKPSTAAMAQQKLDSMTLEQKVYQMFFVAPESLTGVEKATSAGDATKEALTQMPVGGIVYFGKNVETPDQIKEMLANTNAYSEEITGLPMFLGVDEEGGTVARVARNKAFGVQNVGNMQDIKTVEEAGKVGDYIGSYLADIGFNVDFAPDADVMTNTANEVSKKRSFGSDPEFVSQCSAAVSDGLHNHGILSCYKHYPDHGATAGDSHEEFVSINKSLEEMKQAELVPFADANSAGADFIMAAHIAVPQVTGDNLPTSLSSVMLTDVLKKDLGYDGIIITDALNMDAIVNGYSADNSAVMAIEAGADMIMMPLDNKSAAEAIIKAVQDGTIPESRIDESVLKIITKKLELQ